MADVAEGCLWVDNEPPVAKHASLRSWGTSERELYGVFTASGMADAQRKYAQRAAERHRPCPVGRWRYEDLNDPALSQEPGFLSLVRVPLKSLKQLEHGVRAPFDPQKALEFHVRIPKVTEKDLSFDIWVDDVMLC